jgi:hypothetical protein
VRTSDEDGAGTNVEVDDSRLLVDIAQAALARDTARVWKVEPAEFWCQLTPLGHTHREQGWKLHVSATLLSAPIVLTRACEVLVRSGCAFKFARGLDQLSELLSNVCDRGSGGKFITAYPADDEQFRRLAAELDRATEGLPGPVVLSDRPVRTGSIVYYRYGVFSAQPVFTNDGSLESMMVAPDGTHRRDERLAWFNPPPWAVPPLPGPRPAAAAGQPAQPESVLIGDRFVVSEAIRHSYRGGVYRATDRETGDEVILKQARPHVMGLLTGTDARDALRHEADILDQLSPFGLAPRAVALVTHQRNLFLAQETVPGVTLRNWSAERAGVWGGRGAPLAEALDKTRQLVEVMAAVHGRGLVLRDFNPNNLMVTPDGTLRLIDLELAVAAGTRVHRAFTPGYGAPEQVAAPKYGAVPSTRADLFCLGVTILNLVTAVEPILASDRPAGRPHGERLAELVRLVGLDMPALRVLSPLVVGLTNDDPEQRWPLDRAREFLATVDDTADGATEDTEHTATAGRRLPSVRQDRLVTDGLTHTLRTMKLDSARPWPAGEFGSKTDPCNVQHGAAGVLGVLTRAARTLHDEKLGDGVSAVAGWIQRRLFDVPKILPGLYFGRSGTAWALFDAARFLGDEEMAARAVELAKRVPVDWPNHDICHGATGAGMLQAHLWLATGDAELRERMGVAADTVLHAAREREDGLLTWPIPTTFDSQLAGLVHLGFAHGVAGAGTFLLYAWLATDRTAYLDAALRAAQTLAVEADRDGAAAWWRTGEEEALSTNRMRHWCSGSSGIGTFLIRLWAATGEERYRDLAEAAGVAVHRGKWYSGLSSCHGLAGDADFLLDLAEFTGEQRYRDWAAELATAMYARNTTREGLLVLPDESGTEVTVGYNTGLGGAIAFLLRLRHGGPRQWMLDELLQRGQVRPAVEAGLLAGVV